MKPRSPRWHLLKALYDAVIQERHEAQRAAYVARPGSPDIVEADGDLLDHIDRIYIPRIERLERLKAEAQ